MSLLRDNPVCISGIGITTSIGQGKDQVMPALFKGEHNFATMQRPGRQLPESAASSSIPEFIGCEIVALTMPDSIPDHLLRNSSLSARVALSTIHEAWVDANLTDMDPVRIGLIVGGSNLQQRELVLIQQRYTGKENFLRPAYGLSFMDTDIAGVCCEAFGIKGFANSIGGASASGQLAVIQAAKAVACGAVDVCIALGALMDISYWECQSLRSLGAMGSNNFGDRPQHASRPFDSDRDGFIYGEACAAIVIERKSNEARKNTFSGVCISGTGFTNDANRNPNPSCEGEVRSIELALEQARLTPRDIDYISPHGTGSIIGDETELAALMQCNLNHAHINSTKSILGHGLTAAGAVEIAVAALQMQQGILHPSRNLIHPIRSEFQWVKDKLQEKSIANALSMSMGFGGINTTVCLSNF